MAIERLTYNGYTGIAHYSEEEKSFIGTIDGIDEKITYRGKDKDELVRDFMYIVNEMIQSN